MGDNVTALDEILQRYLDRLLDTFKKWEGQTVDVYEEISSFVHFVQFTLVGFNILFNILCLHCYIYIVYFNSKL